MRKTITSIILLAALCLGAEARTVSGTVKAGETRLKAVIVTDGRSFTQTDRNGKFRLSVADDAEYVSIVTPAGYVADWSKGAPEFYRRIGTGSIDFDLLPYGNGNDYHIVAIADPQTKTKKHFLQFKSGPLKELAQTCIGLSQSAATVGLALGDIAWDSGELIFPMYRKEIVSTGVPFYPVIGNHDYDKEAKGDHETSSMYRDVFGPENYAFGLGKDYVLVLDNILYDTQKNYIEGYTDEVCAWVEGLMPFIPADARIYVASHCPAYKWFKGEFQMGTEKLIGILGDHEVTFLTGHTHINNVNVFSDHVVELNVAAICGTWWDTYHCNDGTPGGYKVISSKDGKIDWYYKSIGRDRSFQHEVFPLGAVEEYPQSIVVNVWDYDPSWTVEWIQDGKPMGSMEQVTVLSPLYIKEINDVFGDKAIPSYKQPRLNKHYFRLTPSDGASRIQVEITSRFGQKWTETLDLR